MVVAGHAAVVSCGGHIAVELPELTADVAVVAVVGDAVDQSVVAPAAVSSGLAVAILVVVIDQAGQCPFAALHQAMRWLDCQTVPVRDGRRAAVRAFGLLVAGLHRDLPEVCSEILAQCLVLA